MVFSGIRVAAAPRLGWKNDWGCVTQEWGGGWVRKQSISATLLGVIGGWVPSKGLVY